MALSERFVQAFEYAFGLHIKQLRKGTRTPYISHLLAVAALVLEDGGSEDEAIAALLHDAPEDQGGLIVLEEIRFRFGEYVAEIVAECTDSFETPKPPWRGRKERYLQRLRGAPPEVRRVSIADKLHNVRSIVMDIRRYGNVVWARFNGGEEGTLWYYRSLIEVFRESGTTPMLVALEESVAAMEALIKSKDKPESGV